MLHVAVPLTVGSVVVLIALSILLVVARVRRDRREAVQRARRARVARALDSDDANAVLAVTLDAVADVETRCDLADALRDDPTRADAARRHAPRVLVALAIRDTRHHSAIRRALGAELVALLGRADDLPHVARVLHTEADRQARRVAARALSRRGDPAAARHLMDALVRESLPPDRIVEQLGKPFAVEPMVAALSSPVYAEVRPDLIAALGLARDPLSVLAVSRFVREGDRMERLRACRALGRLGRPEAVPLLIFAMGDASHTVRAMAAKSLGELADPRAVSVLAVSLRDTYWWVRANAAEALRRCGPAGVTALEQALHLDDRFARDRAAEALALHHAAQSGLAQAAA